MQQGLVSLFNLMSPTAGKKILYWRISARILKDLTLTLTLTLELIHEQCQKTLLMTALVQAYTQTPKSPKCTSLVEEPEPSDLQSVRPLPPSSTTVAVYRSSSPSAANPI